MTTFGYDGLGRRVRKTHNGITTRYLWDGDQIVMQLDGAGQPQLEFSYYPGVDRPHAVRDAVSSTIYYYAQDASGNVTGLLNAQRQAVNSYRYSPFGLSLARTEQVVQPFQFAGRQLDAETGLYYNRARYYDPALARFISEDPIGLAGGVNPYAYAGNDPVNYRDPTGLWCVSFQLFSIDVEIGTTCGDSSEKDAKPKGSSGDNSGQSANFGNANARGGSLGGIPFSGVPSSFQSERLTIREYGPNGMPLKDFDWHRPHGPQTTPHVHDWKQPPNSYQDRTQWRPVNPGELSSRWSPHDAMYRNFLTLLTGLLSRAHFATPVLMVNPCLVDKQMCRPSA